MRRSPLFAVLLACLSAAAVANEPDATAFTRHMRRGVNVLGYDGLWKGEVDAPFRMSDFRLIRDAGFDHVRVNFFGLHYLSDPARARAALASLDRVLDAAAAAGLYVVLDQHDNRSCQSEPPACANALRSFWREIARRYRGRQRNLVYEILNEPGGAMTAAAWNDALRAALEAIRAEDPERPVVVAALNVEDMHSVEALRLPESDRNLIVSFHYYAPMSFAFQGAPWSPKWASLSGIVWGADAEKQKIDSDFAVIAAWARARGRPVYLGEFGVFERAPATSRMAWTQHVARTAEGMGWSWAYWQFDHDFALFDSVTHEWNEPLLRALLD